MDFSAFLQRLEVLPHRSHFERVLAQRCRPGRHGDLPDWLATLAQLPTLITDHIKIDDDTVTIGQRDEISQANWQALDTGLRALAPWRKGPFSVFGCVINTEWRSDWKWNRLRPHISDLNDRVVLDVGCGTGYHGWRMLGDGARQVLGIDPSMRFLVQFMAIQKYANDQRFDFLPIGIEDMPSDWPIFDSVFSMGVIYHRRNPINHLHELYGLMKPGAELVLETLIVDQAPDGVLTPVERYAKMRNVWSIMTVDKILDLIQAAGFEGGRCVDQNVTSLQEQRRTDWMQFHSLKEFLDPDDVNKTVEGYPAPKRGIFIANKPTA